MADEEALASALNRGRIQEASLDVLLEESVRAKNRLIGTKNCCITLHIA